MLKNKKMFGLAAAVLLSFFLANAVYAQVDAVNAVGTLSTEKRYSAGRFTSDVDDFIDVTAYNPAIGTFFFLGGFPNVKDGNVNDTDGIDNPPTGSTVPNYGGNTKISVGVGKTLSNGNYLGIYYGGNLVNAKGHNDKTATDKKTNSDDQFTWHDKLAVLYGLDTMAFRLDIFMPDLESESETVGGNFDHSKADGGGGLGVTWGLPGEHGIFSDIYLSLGYLFGDVSTTGVTDAGGKTKKYTSVGESLLGLAAGAGFGASYVDVWMNFTFPASWTDNNGTDDVKHSSGGGFNIGAEYSYLGEIDLGTVVLKFRPYAGLDLDHKSGDSKHGKDSVKAPGEDNFEIYTGVEAGVKFQVKEKITLYTGVNLDILGFNTQWYPGGGDGAGNMPKNTNVEWEITGIKWNADRWNDGASYSHLSLGLTYTPVENVVIGFGLRSILDKLFFIDLENMQAGAGDFFENSGANNVGDWATNLFRGITIDLTVSCSFGGSSRE